MSDHINRLLTDFGNALGLDGLSLDENGNCCLSFDEVVVNIESVGESSLVLFYSSLGVLPEDAGRDVYSRLLAANYFFYGTAGATVGVEPASGNVALTRVVDATGMEVLDLEAVIKAFVDAAESCAARLSTDAVADEPQSAAFRIGNSILA